MNTTLVCSSDLGTSAVMRHCFQSEKTLVLAIEPKANSPKSLSNIRDNM